MKTIRRVYLLIVGVLTAIWLVADNVLSTKYEFFALRESLLNYTGILGIGTMSVAMILAIRPVSTAAEQSVYRNCSICGELEATGRKRLIEELSLVSIRPHGDHTQKSLLRGEREGTAVTISARCGLLA